MLSLMYSDLCSWWMFAVIFDHVEDLSGKMLHHISIVIFSMCGDSKPHSRVPFRLSVVRAAPYSMRTIPGIATRKIPSIVHFRIYCSYVTCFLFGVGLSVVACAELCCDWRIAWAISRSHDIIVRLVMDYTFSHRFCTLIPSLVSILSKHTLLLFLWRIKHFDHNQWKRLKQRKSCNHCQNDRK